MNQRAVVIHLNLKAIMKWLTLVVAVSVSIGAHATTVHNGTVLQQHLRYQLENTTQYTSLDLTHSNEVRGFYDTRDQRPVWSNNVGLSSYVADFLIAVDAAEHHGLSTSGYHRDKITFLSTSSVPGDKAKLDLLLTDAFFTYAKRMGQGQIKPSAFDEDWHYEIPDVDPSLLLSQVKDEADMQRVIKLLQPQHIGYKQLKAALKSYSDIRKAGGWKQLNLQGVTLEYGSYSSELPLLRQRLRMTRDLDPNSPDEPVFDYELEQAVKSFQMRHGLQIDGKVGKKTRYALNIPVEKRVEQLKLNLERWRWLPRHFSERYIMVNTADFSLKAYDSNRDPLSMKVVVGKQKRKTPSFSELMTHVVVNPYWNIPTKLAVEDLVPSELSKPGYMEKKNIRVLSDWSKNAEELDPSTIDWSAFVGKKYLPYRLRQDPGRSNSLGRIKFMFPNQFSVYMHDTPSRRLFNRNVRAFSSGCIRLERPFDLASYLLGSDPKLGKIMRLIRSGENQRVRLPEPVPVHLLYLTSWAENGQIQFRDDIYQKDALMMANMPLEKGRFTLNAENIKSAILEPVSLHQN